jgi:polar amino acid transport system substrate-binding protein
MKFLRCVATGILMGMLVIASLGLTGCFSPNKEGSLALPKAVIAPPNIAQEGVLRVGVDSSHAPFAGLSDGHIVGIDVDIAAALAERMGLKLEKIDIKGQEPNTLLQSGSVDVIMGIQGDSAATFSGVQVGPYLVDGPAAFSVDVSSEPQAFDPAQLKGMQVVAQEGSLSAWQVSKEFGDDKLSTRPSLALAFDELVQGAASYAAADAIVGSFLAVQYDNVRCAGLLGESQNVCIGIATGKPDLASALTDALRTLHDQGSLRVIVAKWLGSVSAQTVVGTQAIVAQEPSADKTAGGTAANSANPAVSVTPAPSEGGEGGEGGAAANTAETAGDNTGANTEADTGAGIDDATAPSEVFGEVTEETPNETGETAPAVNPEANPEAPANTGGEEPSTQE